MEIVEKLEWGFLSYPAFQCVQRVLLGTQPSTCSTIHFEIAGTTVTLMPELLSSCSNACPQIKQVVIKSNLAHYGHEMLQTLMDGCNERFDVGISKSAIEMNSRE